MQPITHVPIRDAMQYMEDTEREIANLREINAELVAALRNMIAAGESTWAMSSEHPKTMLEARRILAKAEGR